MARNFRELQAKMSPERRARNEQRLREAFPAITLMQLRNDRQLNQEEIAKIMGVPQSSVSRIEQRADMYLSTLRNYVHAMGGHLQVQAVFPEETVTISVGRYSVNATPGKNGKYVLEAQPCGSGIQLWKPDLDRISLLKTLRLLDVSDSEVTGVLDKGGSAELSDRLGVKQFSLDELVSTGFEEKPLP